MGDPQGVVFQLRHVGKPPSKPNVAKIMILDREITKFGRHSGNDYFLDSADLDCFISRWHAEIHRVSHNKYIIKDKSLNGTYVNNHRVLGNHVLSEGEIICFGHTNGKNLKPGDYAPQKNSEFEFMFEPWVPDDPDAVKITGVQPAQKISGVQQPAQQESPPQADSTTGLTDLPSPRGPPTHVSGEGESGVNSSSLTQHPSHITITSNTSLSPDAKPEQTSPPLQDISNKSSSSSNSPVGGPVGGPGLVSLDQFVTQPGGGTRPSAPCNITVSVTAGLPVSQQSQRSPQTAIQTTVPAIRSSGPGATSPPISRPSLVSAATLAYGNTSLTKAGIKMPAPTRNIKAKPAPSSFKNITATSGKRKQDGGPRSSEKRSRMYDDDDEFSEEDSDDDTWHYDGDKCDAPTCRKPASAKVSWVQCDDCDAWYHIQCAGCRYDRVKKKNAEFHCGCV